MLYITSLDDARIKSEWDNKRMYLEYATPVKEALDKIYLSPGAQPHEYFSKKNCLLWRKQERFAIHKTRSGTNSNHTRNRTVGIIRKKSPHIAGISYFNHSVSSQYSNKVQYK